MLELMTAMPEVPGGAERSCSSTEAAQPEEGGESRDLETWRGDFRPGMAQATERRAAVSRRSRAAELVSGRRGGSMWRVSIAD